MLSVAAWAWRLVSPPLLATWIPTPKTLVFVNGNVIFGLSCVSGLSYLNFVRPCLLAVCVI
jgi:hypothetical protein